MGNIGTNKIWKMKVSSVTIEVIQKLESTEVYFVKTATSRKENQSDCFDWENWIIGPPYLYVSHFDGLLWTECRHFRKHQAQNLALWNSYWKYRKVCYKPSISFLHWCYQFCSQWYFNLAFLQAKCSGSNQQPSKVFLACFYSFRSSITIRGNLDEIGKLFRIIFTHITFLINSGFSTTMHWKWTWSHFRIWMDWWKIYRELLEIPI